MTTEEYIRMEREALSSLQRIRELGIRSDDIVFLMDRDVYLTASRRPDTIVQRVDYPSDLERRPQIRHVFRGYDVFIADEESPPVFSPALKGFQIAEFNYSRLSLGDIVLSESVDEDPHVFVKMHDEPTTFNDMGVVARPAYGPVLMGFDYADRQPVFEHRNLGRPWFSFDDLDVKFTFKNGSHIETARRSEKEWDEKLTPEDTKELDEFLNSITEKTP